MVAGQQNDRLMKVLRFACRFLLLASCLASTDRGLQDTTLECGEDQEVVTLEAHYLLDLLGFPGQIFGEDLDDLESSFVVAYTQVAQCSYGNVEVSILRDAIDGYGNDDASTIETTFLERKFSYLVSARAQKCQKDVCNETSESFLADEDRRYLEVPHQLYQNRLRARRAQDANSTDGSCSGCAVSKSLFLSHWQQELASSEEVSQIIDLSPVAFEEDCAPADFSKFSTSVYLTVESSLLTDSDIEHLSQIFLEAYNELNALNAESCDPYR
jgi:hypothetical protein